MSVDTVKMDDRGRVTIGRHISKRGAEPSLYYGIEVDDAGRITLEPLRLSFERVAA